MGSFGKDFWSVCRSGSLFVSIGSLSGCEAIQISGSYVINRETVEVLPH
jgi:hypothetical protein